MKKIFALAVAAMLTFAGNAYAGSFTDHGDGTVTDNVKGLMWQQQDDDVTRTWQQALDYCNSLTLAGYADWRLPNVKELDSIADDVTYSPAIDETAFPNTNASYYWSSTTDASNPSYAWYVSFYFSGAHGYYKSGSYYVRCVR